LQSMKQDGFTQTLEHALAQTALKHGMRYPEGGARAWAQAATAYLGFALCGFPQADLRRLQHQAREVYGSVILDCRWYAELKDYCMGGLESVQALLPGREGTMCLQTVTASLFLEMLDFCRDG